MKLTAAQRARLEELKALQDSGTLSDTEQKEFDELNEKAKLEDGEAVSFTQRQLAELIQAGVEPIKKKNEELENQVQELAKGQTNGVFGAQDYERAERGVRPVIQTQRKEAIGADLRDFILNNKETKALTTLTDAAGGILIPVEFRDTVIFYAGIYGIARRRCMYNRMTSGEQQIDAIANEPIAYWVDEDDDTTESSPTFADMSLVAKELAVLVTASKSFIADLKDSRGIDVFDMLGKLFGKAMAKKEDNEFINGTGTPFTGILGSADVPSYVMPSTKTSFADITYDDLIKATRKVPVEFKKGYKPTWLMSQDVMANIEILKDDQGLPIFLRGFKDGESDRLLGFEVEPHDLAPGTADDGVSTPFIGFGDPEHCSFGDRESMDVEVYRSGTVGAVNLIAKRRIGIQATQRVALQIHNPKGFVKIVTAAS